MNRKIKILKYLQEYKKATVREIAEHLELSDISVRRYLSQLEEENLIKRTHGGAELPVTRLGIEYPFEARLLNNLSGKIAIANEALNYIDDGDTIGFDLGTTVFKLVENVIGQRNITATSASLKICSMLMGEPGIKLMVPAGEAYGTEGAITGILAERSISNFYYDSFFLSAGGVSTEGVLSDYHLNEILIKQAFMANAKQVILLLDYTKFDTLLRAKLTQIGSIDLLITDRDPNEEFKKLLESNKITLIVAKK